MVESNPAFAIVVAAFTVNETVSEDEGHVPFETVHTKVFVPILIPVIPDVGEAGLVIVAPPVIIVHKPVPITGVFPESVPLAEQSV